MLKEFLFSTMGGPQQDPEGTGNRRVGDPPSQTKILLQRCERRRQVKHFSNAYVFKT